MTTKEAGVTGNQGLRIGAGVGIVIVLSPLAKRWAAITVAVLGALCAVIAFADMTNAAGSGIYLTLAGGLVALCTGIVAARRRRVPIETTDA